MYLFNIKGNNLLLRNLFTSLLIIWLPGLLWASAAQADPFVYVANQSDNTVSVIDAAINTVVNTIGVGASPDSVAITPNNKQVYVTNAGDNTVSVINATNQTVVGNPISVGTFPIGIAVTPDSKSVYIANAISNDVSVIDTATNTVKGSPIPVGRFPQKIAISPDGKHAYVTNSDDNTVSVIDTTTNTVIGNPIAVGTDPIGIAIAPDGKWAYVGNLFSSTVSVIDTAVGTVVGNPISANNPYGIALSPDGKRLYATQYGDGAVSVIDLGNNDSVLTLSLGVPPPVTKDIALTADGKLAYFIASNSVQVIDTSTNTIVGSPIIVGRDAIGIAITPFTRFVSFSANLTTRLRTTVNTNNFSLGAAFGLAAGRTADVNMDDLFVQVGNYTAVIPAGAWHSITANLWTYSGILNGAQVKVNLIRNTPSRYTLTFGANVNPETTKVKLLFGNNGDQLPRP